LIVRALYFLLGLAALFVAVIACVFVTFAMDDNARPVAKFFGGLAVLGAVGACWALGQAIRPATGSRGGAPRCERHWSYRLATLINSEAITEEEIVVTAEREDWPLEIVAAHLPSLSPNTARKVMANSPSPFARLHFSSLKLLSVETAQVLSEHLGPLHLDGLAELSPQCARHLAKNPSPLHLNGLHVISEETAEALSKHVGWLFLDGLTSLSPAVARHLSRHSFAVHLGSFYNMLSLNGVKELSPDSACALSTFAGNISLNGLTTLRPEVAQCLARHIFNPKYPEAEEYSLVLDGVTTLSGAAATAIAEHKGGLSLNGIETLSREALEALARYRGESLSLKRLQAMTDEVAETFGNQTKHLYVPNLRSISRRGLAALKRNPYIFLPRQPAEDDGGGTANS
jgi:hypothetical protein